jgi:Uma2 family endonuclease
MTTVILGDLPEVQMLIEKRRALGLDKRDEVWEGVYYVVPHAGGSHSVFQMRLGRVLEDLVFRQGLTVSGEFNLGESDDFRIPDLGIHEGPTDFLYFSSAVVAIEILSPNDKTFEKFDFYFRRGVREVMVADLKQKSLRVWQSGAGGFVETDYSDVLATPVADVAAAVVWP